MNEVVPYDVFKMIFYQCDTITQFRIKQTNRKNSQLVIKSIYDKRNNITDEILERYADLEEIVHEGKVITDKSLVKLTKLKKLELRGDDDKMSITDKSLQYLTNLEELIIDLPLGDYDITDISLGQLKKLKVLILNSDQIYDVTHPKNGLINLVNLTQLNLTGNIDDDILVNLINLEKVKLYGNNCVGTFLKNNSKITELSINSCMRITDDNLHTMENLKKLKLAHSNKNLNCVGLSTFHKLIKLRIESQNVTDDTLNNLTNLKKLNLSWCYGISGTGLKNLINIENLGVYNCNHMRDCNITNMINLKVIEFHDNPKMKVTGININNLENIEIINCPYINNKSIINYKKIKQITVEGESNLKIWKMKNLEKLKITNYNGLNDKNIIYLNKLKELILSDIPNITDITIDGLKYLNQLETLRVESYRESRLLTESWIQYIEDWYKLNNNLHKSIEFGNSSMLYIKPISKHYAELINENKKKIKKIKKNLNQLDKKKKDYKNQKSKVKKIIKNFK